AQLRKIRVARGIRQRNAVCVFAPAPAGPVCLISIGVAVGAVTHRRRTMTKSKIAIVAALTTMLVAGASSAMAFDRQATDDALGYASVQAARAGVPSGAF